MGSATSAYCAALPLQPGCSSGSACGGTVGFYYFIFLFSVFLLFWVLFFVFVGTFWCFLGVFWYCFWIPLVFLRRLHSFSLKKWILDDLWAVYY